MEYFFEFLSQQVNNISYERLKQDILLQKTSRYVIFIQENKKEREKWSNMHFKAWLSPFLKLLRI